MECIVNDKFTPHRLVLIILDNSRKFQALKHLSYKEQQKKSPDITRASDDGYPLHQAWKEQFLQPWTLLCHLQLFSGITSSQASPCQSGWAVSTGCKDALHFWALSLEVQLWSPGWSPEAALPWMDQDQLYLVCSHPESHLSKPTVKSHCLQKYLPCVWLPKLPLTSRLPQLGPSCDRLAIRPIREHLVLLSFHIKSWISRKSWRFDLILDELHI